MRVGCRDTQGQDAENKGKKRKEKRTEKKKKGNEEKHVKENNTLLLLPGRKMMRDSWREKKQKVDNRKPRSIVHDQ